VAENEEERGMESANGLDWLTKQEAVSLTKISLRTIEREIAAGNVRTKQRRQVGRRSVTVLHPDDVERLRSDFTPLSSASEPAGVEEGSIQLPVLRPAADVLTALVQNLHPLVKEHRLFLPIKEAATYAGLPEGYLRKMIKAGKLKPILHGGYYIRLRDFDKL
jgi:hypothetical protein